MHRVTPSDPYHWLGDLKSPKTKSGQSVSDPVSKKQNEAILARDLLLLDGAGAVSRQAALG